MSCHPYVEINVDASWVTASNKGFIGVVVMDYVGGFITARRCRLYAPSAAADEALAILRGCEVGQSLGLNLVVVESNSLDSISSLKGSITNGTWEAFPTLAKCKKIGDSFDDCR